MKLTILETGLPPAELRDDWPRYPEMFEGLIGPHMAELTYESVAVVEGAPFPDPAALDAVLITGSAAGVYEDQPWMQPLFDFIQEAAQAGTPQIGVCFGHQALARAMGGEVDTSDKGWGIGRHTYDICLHPDWMEDKDLKKFALGVSHQDQVQSLPEGARVVAASDFTPFAALDYPDLPAISFQGHPEFSAGFCRALYKVRQGSAFSKARVKEASDSLKRHVDNELVGLWMANFLRNSALNR